MTEESLALCFFKFVVSYILAVPLLIYTTPYFRLYDYFTLGRASAKPNSPEIHRRKVERVQAQVRAWNHEGRPNRMCTARKAWKTMSIHNMKKGKYTQTEIEMNDIVEIDETNRVLTVEPGMMMGKLTSILIPMGWTIPVVPELDTLTVGGVTCGAGIETSSHKYGLFCEALSEMELVAADGELVTCSRKKNSDLFYAVSMSHGTLGFLTAVKIPLIPAKKYVKLEYIPTESVDEVRKLCGTGGHDFVEGIVYGPKKFIVMYGDMVNATGEERGKVNHINRWYKVWFYKHAEGFLRRGRATRVENNMEYIPLRDYYHRHTRGFFWETQAVVPYGNSWLFRWLIGWVYPINFQMAKYWLPNSVYETYFVTNHVLQDIVIRLKDLEKCLDFLHTHFKVYPLWLCPMMEIKSHRSIIDTPWDTPEMLVDVGIYGRTPKVKEFESEATTRLLEQFLIHDIVGFQAMYADSYLTREEFGKMFSLNLYKEVRAKYNCVDAFPEIYDKVSKHARGIAKTSESTTV